jgi:hypothetical protein
MEYKQITQAIDDMDQLHQDHIEAFDHTLLPDLESQSRQRDQALRGLTQKITALINSVTNRSLQGSKRRDKEETDACLAVFHARISNLLHQNRVLAQKVRQHRDGIEKSMKRNVAGKSILRSYGSVDLKLNRPRVMSFTE